MKIAIRADASPGIGTGHFMRCLALTQGLKDNGDEVVFITHCEGTGFLERIEKEKIRTYIIDNPDDENETGIILEKENADWVVLDGYHFGPVYQKKVKENGHKLLVIDDHAVHGYYFADVILNQNYGAEGFHYNAGPDTKFLLGTGYALLRREFLRHADYRKEISDTANKILVTMGGSDIGNHTFKAVQAINLISSPLEVKVVIGGSNPHYETILKETGKGIHRFDILRSVENMAPLMIWADIALSAGGSTCWEMAFMGLPALLCIVADNQENMVKTLDRDGIFKSLGWIDKIDKKEISAALLLTIHDKIKRSEVNRKSRTIVDGFGVKRLRDELNVFDYTSQSKL